MTPKQKRKHIATVEQASILLLDGSSEKMGKSARAAARKRERLTSTGKFCDELKITHRPAIYMPTPSAHMQFYERKIDGNRNSID
jgi:hypothetical protein|tara:strand:+ start:58 stop:312 length:255 start_codon:yes stop_codon:yes gene_type:complete